jgi:beta-lactamase regulating signal transducer with metallopeptidase domain
LISYLGLQISQILFLIGFVFFWARTLYFTSRVLLEGLFFVKKLKSMMKRDSLCNRPIMNLSLLQTLQKNNVKIFSNADISIPMATYFKSIFIPNDIVEDFSQGEYEAIIAHELEHVLWKDQIVRLLTQLVAKIFWWVPTSAWLKKLEFDQELACDQNIAKYGLDNKYLASALIKVTRSAKKNTYKTICFLSNETHPTLKRIQIILGMPTVYSKRCKWVNYSIAFIGLTLTAICSLWV